MNVAVLFSSVGVPLTCPVLVLKDNPAGRLGLTAYVMVPPPPVAVIGMKGVAIWLMVSVVVATD